MSNGDALVGASVTLPVSAATLFGETQSRIVVTCAPEHVSRLAGMVLGTTGGDTLRIGKLAWPVAQLREAWWNAIAHQMDR
jgi:hypothetical protein